MQSDNAIPIVTCLTRYPIKSTAGEKLVHANIKSSGIEHDRHWMIVDESGVFITQRKLPRMALINARVINSRLHLSIPDQSEVEIQEPREDDWRKVKIWSDQINVHTLSSKVDRLLSEFLQKPSHLVVMSDKQPRRISDEAAKGVVSFADALPFLLIGTASLEALNNKLEKPVSMSNFRPNIMVRTNDAHEEDNWHEIRIGEVIFRNVKPCSRCILTTVNPETGLRSKDGEPLKTLLSYRQVPTGEVMFGCNLIAVNSGVIRVDDPIEVLSTIES